MNKLKIQYKPGLHPLPMIAMYEKPNKNIFDETYQYKFHDYNDQNFHIWTIDAYIIHNKNEIIAFRFNQLSNFVWLLRKIGLPLKFELDQEIFENQIKDLKDEFELIHK